MGDKKVVNPCASLEAHKIDDDDPRIARWAEITELAIRECGTMDQASRWLNMPKIALQGRTPLEALTTPGGCDAVERLLHELNS